MRKIVILFVLIAQFAYSQSQKLSEIPDYRSQISVDTLVNPDRIYLKIFLNEKDTKNKNIIEEKYKTMINILKKIGINVEKQLSIDATSSNSIKKFINTKVLKSEIFDLLVYDAQTTIKVINELNQNDITNIFIYKKLYSKANEIVEILKVKALKIAKNNAETLMKSVGQSIGKVLTLEIYENITNKESFSGSVEGIKVRGIGNIDDNDYFETEFSPIKLSTRLTIQFEIK